MNERNIFEDLEHASRIAEVFEKIAPNVKVIHENREKIYKISRMLPEKLGYELLNLHDSTVHNIVESYQKVKK